MVSCKRATRVTPSLLSRIYICMSETCITAHLTYTSISFGLVIYTEYKKLQLPLKMEAVSINVEA